MTLNSNTEGQKSSDIYISAKFRVFRKINYILSLANSIRLISLLLWWVDFIF